MPAPLGILELVTRFEQQLAAYKSGTYNETQLRRDFLDPFFKALGWDMDNSAGYAEAYRDVIHEDAVKIGGLTKAPDYGFRIGGTRKFFLEAKKPSVVIRDEIPPAYQLRRYAWNAKLPLSILSDFEEFAVYDGRIKPRKDEPAATARVFYCTFRDYAEQWDWIASIFSREAVLKGSFDRYAESHRTKRGTTEVDVDFLATIEGWRTDLANNLALRNPKLSQRELNFAVQRILDRIIFLRICEDRGIEDYGRLLALTNGPRIYARLRELFTAADARYNSGLFHFQPEKGRDEPPDELTLNLEVDDKLLRDLFKGLYYPDSPYEFRIISSDILGQVYEQFLGKVIRLTEGHRAKVEDKPEVKKAGGVYYTPTYIVDYIVQQTVGKLLDDCTRRSGGNEARTTTKQSGNANAVENGQETTASTVPPAHFPAVLPALSARDAARILERVSKLRILDPACGSGSFLIGAYQLLLDWHLRFYLANEPGRWAKGKRPALVQTTKGWRLTIEERKRILLAHIYGVDIDAQAVEVTKLSLLLKVLEGETGQSLQPLFSVFHERALPDLGRNIKCGNSLIGPDFYQQAELPLLTDEERYRLNVFDWHAEFPEIFKAGGFDAVIGNPPYVDIKGLPESDVEYIFGKFSTSNNRINLFASFLEQSLNVSKQSGFRVSMIVPTALLTQESYRELRRRIIDTFQVASVVRLPNESFGAAAGCVKVDTVVVAFSQKLRDPDPIEIISYAGYDRIAKIDPTTAHVHTKIPPERWAGSGDFVWSLNTGTAEEGILNKCEQRSVPLEACAEFCLGLTPYDKYKGHTVSQIKGRAFHADSKKDKTFKRLLAGNDVTRYGVRWNGEEWISYGPWLGAPREQRFFTKKRILVKQIIDWTTKRIWAAITDEELYNTQNAFNLLANGEWQLEYLLGLLNSRLMTFYHQKKFLDEFKMRFQKILIKDCRRFPIRVIDSSDKPGKDRHERIVKLVESMLELHRQLPAVRTPQEKTALERQIAATDSQIDRLVYDLYGLTEEEIAIVEGRNATVPAPKSPAADSSEPSEPPERDGMFAELPVPPRADLTPEKAYGDAAHFYSANETPPPYRSD